MDPTSKTTVLSYRPTEFVGANRLAYFLLFLYIVTKPFYFFDSGSPQIADFIAVILFFIVFLSKGHISKSNAIIWSVYLIFCAYSVLISALYFVSLGDPRTLKAGIFYTFNALMLYVVLKLGEDNRKFIVALMSFVVMSCVVQVIFSLAMQSEFKREILFFNNPNQFAYWGLLSATIYCICARQIGVRIFVQILAWIVFSYLVLLGLSKAATIALFVLAGIHFFRKPKHIFLFVVCAALLFVVAQGTEIVSNVSERLGNIGQQQDDSIMGRGYDRILDYPQYLLFGAGEYALERFPGVVHEIHSTVGTVIFSYGFVGTLILGTFVWLLFRRVGLSQMLYALPAFVYGGVHNGTRFTLLWMLFGLIAITGVRKSEKKSNN